MKIKYIGKSGIREIKDDRGRFVWAPDVDYAQEVPASLAAELLTYPRPDFVVDIDEPLLQLDGVGVQIGLIGETPKLSPLGTEGLKSLQVLHDRTLGILGNFAIVGIGTISDLAALDEAGAQALCEATGFERKQVDKWIRQAQKLAGE